MIDAVVFDLDDTLCEYERPAAELLALAFERVDAEPFFTYEDYFEVFQEHAERETPIREIRERCFAALAEERGIDPALGRAIAREYAAERNHGNVRFRPGAREAFDAIAADHQVAMVTNGGPEMQRAKLEALGIDEAFETIVYAGYDCPPKPAPDPFHRVLEVLEVDPERAVHVGNSLESDVAGAAAAGMRSVWVPTEEADPADHEPDYVFDSMTALRTPPWA